MKEGEGLAGERIAWHAAFCAAVQVELHGYAQGLTFESEHQLNTEPLRIDLLVVKKSPSITIEKSFARVFRGHNILEYKSPDDTVTISDFLKVFAYVAIYADINNVDITDMTMTLFASKYPRRLLKEIKTVYGLEIKENEPGIIRTELMRMPVQIIDSKQLDADENLWLNSLRRDNERSRAEKVVSEIVRSDEDIRRLLGAYFDAVATANEPVYVEVLKAILNPVCCCGILIGEGSFGRMLSYCLEFW